MADTTLPVTDADNVKRDVAFDENGGVYTPKTYALQSGAWTVGISGTVTVDGTVDAAQSGSWTVDATQSGSWTVAATQSGTWNIDTVTTVTTCSTVTTLTGSSIAHDSADSGNPHKIGAKAVSSLNSQTMVSANDRTNVFADLDGALLTRSDGAVGDRANGTASTTGTSDTSVLAAGGSGIKHHITDVTIANTSANDIIVTLKDGSTAKWVFPVPAKGGVTHAFRTPLSGTANTAWNFAASSASTTVYCSVSGYKSKL